MVPTLVTVTPTSLGAMRSLLDVWLKYWSLPPWWQLIQFLRPWLQCGPAYRCVSPDEYPWGWLLAGGDVVQLPSMGELCRLVCEWKRVFQEHYPGLVTSVDEFADALSESRAKAICLALGNGYDYYWAPILLYSGENGWADVILPMKCIALVPLEARVPRLPVAAPDDVYYAGRSRYAACRDAAISSDSARCVSIGIAPSPVLGLELCREEELAGRLCAVAPTVRGEWMSYSEIMDRFASYLSMPIIGLNPSLNPLVAVLEHAGGAIVVNYDEVLADYESEAWRALDLLSWSTTPGFY